MKKKIVNVLYERQLTLTIISYATAKLFSISTMERSFTMFLRSFQVLIALDCFSSLTERYA